MARLSSIWPELRQITAEIVEQVQVEAQYACYLERQEADIDAYRRDCDHKIPNEIDYLEVSSLSREAQEKLSEAHPATIAGAARIPGVTPAALTALMVHLRRRNAETCL